MNISKTLFKLFTRCSNAPSLYNMLINQGFHDVKEIYGYEINDLKQELSEIKPEEFNDDTMELVNSIFEMMYDSETGEDLTILTSAQLKAFKKVFIEVEFLAAKYIEKIFNEKVIASKNTYEQKKFEYFNNGNKYYCYLDIYIEENNKIKVFEVKSTTSRKFDELHFIFKKGTNSYPLFKKNNITKVMDYIGDEYIGETLDGKEVTESLIKTKLKSVLNRYSDVGKYLYDVSVQRHIIEESFKSKGYGVPEIEYYLVVLNHEYIYDGKMLNGENVYDTCNGHDLFKVYDVNYLTSLYQTSIYEERKLFDERSERLTVVNNCLGKHCRYKKTDQCKFFNVCHKPVLQDGSLLEFTNKHFCFKDLVELNSKNERKTIDMYILINNGIYTMKDSLKYIVDIDQKIEYDCYNNKTQYVDKDNLKFLIDKIKYPIFHLDFESYNCPLPRFNGEKPYTQSLFQYSLHVERSEGDCEIDNENGMYHYEFLSKDHNDCRRALAEQLIKDIDLSNGGTVLAYHADFEKQRINELMVLYDDLKPKLKIIYDSVFDLENVIHASEDFYKSFDPSYSLVGKPKFNFYDTNLHASFSIKKLLPLFTNLTYKDLEVQNGTEAILMYGKLPEFTEEEYKNKYLALKVYCRQDTWSMVKILQGLKKLIK